MSKSLVRSVMQRWELDATLCELVPYESVFVGRVPSTRLYNFPYVAIIATQGRQFSRSDKARYSHGPLSFHIWVDEGSLEDAYDIAEAITKAFADQCWTLGGDDKVMDVLDEGEPLAVQVQLPTVRMWEVVKLFTVVIERARVDTGDCCDTSTSESSE